MRQFINEKYEIRYSYYTPERYVRKNTMVVSVRCITMSKEKKNHKEAEKVFLGIAKEKGINVASVDCVIYC